MAARQHVREDVNTKKAYKKAKRRKIKPQSSDSATEAETEAVVMKMEMVKSGRGTSFQNLLQRCL